MSVCQSPDIPEPFQGQCPDCKEIFMIDLKTFVNHKCKQEIITIKKALWDEMLECRKRIDLHTETFTALLERIEKLEIKVYGKGIINGLQGQIDKQEEQLKERIEKLEELVENINNFLVL